MRFQTQMVLLLGLACSALAMDRPSQRDEDDVREAVFRALIHDAGRAPQGYGVYFLALGENRRDPSDAFMKRFTGERPPVRKVSSCVDKGKEVLDLQSGEKGIILPVWSLKWGCERAEAVGTVHKAGLNGYSQIYTVKKKAGRWQVTEVELKSIS